MKTEENSRVVPLLGLLPLGVLADDVVVILLSFGAEVFRPVAANPQRRLLDLKHE